MICTTFSTSAPRLWPKLMRWEAAYFIVWTRTSVLTKEERKQLKAEYAANAREAGGDRQHAALLHAQRGHGGAAFGIHVARSFRLARARRRRFGA